MNWLRFGHPNLLHLLWGVPFLIALYLFGFQRKQKAYRRFSHHQAFHRLTASVHFRRQKQQAVLMILSYLFLALAIARPQIGTKLELIKRQGLDIIIALDISASMLAEDIKPNRLLKAKHAISSLIDQARGDRLGLIAFAGSSFVQCPLTTDYAATKEFLNALHPSTISHSGTQIDKAIDIAMSSFSSEAEGYKVLIIFSDGEDHGGKVIDAAKSASKENIRIYCVGIGSPNQGVPIPLYEPNGAFLGYKRDETNELVLTKLNDFLLREVAQLTQGNYYQATQDGNEINLLYKKLSSLEKRAFEEQQFTEYEDRFQYFLAFALLFLVWELLLTDRR